IEAYFRGRKLLGKEIKVPEGYQGIVVKEGSKQHDTTQEQMKDALDSNHGEEGDAQDTRSLEEVGSFDEVILWGHESFVEGDDAFVKGLGEWVGFAEAVRSVFRAILLRDSRSASTDPKSRFIGRETKHTHYNSDSAIVEQVARKRDVSSNVSNISTANGDCKL
ncbi:MAG: hypothetical protein Q9217_005665, partial [Psora testacea]